MKFKKLIIYIILTIFIPVIAFLPAAAKNNIALNCKIDSFCCQVNESETASMLVDDDEEYKTKWCAVDGGNHETDSEPHWIIFDFEADKTFDSVRLVKASEGERDYGKEEFDASAFTFWASTDKINWKKVLEVVKNGNKPIYEGGFPGGAVTARYLKLTVECPEQSDDSYDNNENHAVRLYDLKVWEAELPEITDKDPIEENTTEITEANPPPLVAAPNVSDSMFLLILGLIVSSVAIIAEIIKTKNSKSKIKR